MLSATYLYSSSPPDKKLRPPPISVSEYEKSTQPSYFDLESVGGVVKSPMRDALSTSRPATPAYERRPHTDFRSMKRDQ